MAKGKIIRCDDQGNRIWSLRLLKAGSASWGSGAINSDRGYRNAEDPVSVRFFARSKGSSAVNHLLDFSYAIALGHTHEGIEEHSGLDYPWRVGSGRLVPPPSSGLEGQGDQGFNPESLEPD